MSNPNATAGAATNAAIDERPDLRPAPLDLITPQLTFRAVLTGMFLGAVLSTCNIYSGLRVGWSFNMSIPAALLSYAFWMTLHRVFGARKWTMLENNINLTAASSGASVSSAGLVAPIPALAMLTGQTLTWPWLSLWIFSVCLVGITVAVGLRRQMVLVDKLPFPSGIATAEMLRELYAKWSEGVARVVAMGAAGVTACAMVIVSEVASLAPWLPRAFTVGGFPAKNLTLGFDPTLIMYGVGGLIGMRSAFTLALGAVLAWGVFAPNLIHNHYVRLEVVEPLPTLPANVTLMPEPKGHLIYDARGKALKYKGEMTTNERDEFFAQSEDRRFREAVQKLYIRSQLDQATVAALISETATTRPVQIRETLAKWPAALVIPAEFGSMLRYSAADGVLTAIGAVSDACLAALESQAEKLPVAHSEVATAIEAVRRLHKKAKTSRIVAPIPESLASRVTYDVASQTLSVMGQLDASEAGAVKTLAPDDTGFDATIDELTRATTFVASKANFRDIVTWLLWPGVSLMVVASLTSFAFSWRSMLNAFRGGAAQSGEAEETGGEVTVKLWVLSMVVAMALSVMLQVQLFQIALWIAALGVLLSALLAVVGARVAGETNTTPVGAMGKVTQLVFGAIAPGQYAPNLMAANVTGGAASQCADLMFDLKVGHMIGASQRYQFFAQMCGAFAGSLFGSFIYMILIPRPSEQLLTSEWAAPAVATWKAVAELFKEGLHALPPGAIEASLAAAALAIVLTFAEQWTPKKYKWLVLSPASLGLAFVVQANSSFSMFIGALAVACVGMISKSWAARFVTAICSGIIAGDSLTGVAVALAKL